MCLAVPGKVIKKCSDNVAIVDIQNIQQEINISLVSVELGDWVLIHAGIAINKIDEQLAEETLETLRELEVLLDESK
jgi:hydrogenase expression/formation protein HypC